MKKIEYLIYSLILFFVSYISFARGDKIYNINLKDTRNQLYSSFSNNIYKISNFYIIINTEKTEQKSLKIFYKSNLKRAIFETNLDESFVSAYLVNSNFSSSRGSISVKDKYIKKCINQKIHNISKIDNAIEITGDFGNKCEVSYSLKFFQVENHQLSFQLNIIPHKSNKIRNNSWRAVLKYFSNDSEQFYGFGEQFTYLNQKGRRLPIFAQEQGIGRGLEPYTSILNMLGGGTGGSWHSTYTGIPQYISNYNRSLFLENYEYVIFDFTKKNLVEIELHSTEMRGRILYGQNILDLIEVYTKYSGRMKSLPKWIGEGAILGLMGGQGIVNKNFDLISNAGTPISALWIQDWVGKRQAMGMTRMWWNWELDKTLYPDWEELIQNYNKRNIRIMSYINPFVVDVSQKKNYRRNFYQEGKNQGFLIKGFDGKPKAIGNGGYNAYMVDLSNPNARLWYKKVIKEAFIDKGIKGWMADFGEALPMDTIPYSKESSHIFHNRYVEEWNKLNMEIIEENNLYGDAIYLMRSAVAKSPGYTSLFWLGDQVASWDEYDGMKTVVTGLLSSGFSGMSLNHADIGGILEMDYLLFKIKRTKELLQRNMELSAFTAIYRTHEGMIPETSGHHVYSDKETIESFSYFAKIYKALNSYRVKLMKEAERKGYPLVRHPILHYQDDPEVTKIKYQFMLGPEFMIIPVLDEKVNKVDVYLPKGEWIYIWDGSLHGSTSIGLWLKDFKAPIGRPAVFYKKDSKIGTEFRIKLKKQKLI